MSLTHPHTQSEGRATVPWQWYSDPAVLATEIRRIFHRSWQYAGHLGELQGPGSYFASDTRPVPIVITLDTDGVLRGFVNVCRHRGALVATDARRRGTLQCPYHAWTYGLDGCLRAAPRGGEDAAFDPERLGLRPVAVGTWGPFVFANVDPEAEPLEAVLDDLPEVVAAHGLELFRRMRSHVGCWPAFPPNAAAKQPLYRAALVPAVRFPAAPYRRSSPVANSLAFYA